MFEHDGVVIYDPRTADVYPDDDPDTSRLILGYSTAYHDVESGREFVNPFAVGERAWRGYSEIERLSRASPPLFAEAVVQRRKNLSRCE